VRGRPFAATRLEVLWRRHHRRCVREGGEFSAIAVTRGSAIRFAASGAAHVGGMNVWFRYLFRQVNGLSIRQKSLGVFILCLALCWSDTSRVVALSQSEGTGQSEQVISKKQIEEARGFLKQAYEAAPPSSDGSNTEAWLLQDIVEAYAELGDVKEALKIARTIKGEPKYDPQGKALKKIVLARARTGDSKSAIQLAKKIRDREFHRDGVLLDLTEMYVRAGNLKNAVDAADHISASSVLRNKAYAEIGIAQAKAGDLKSALQSIRIIETADIRADIMQHFAIAQAASNVKSAITTARQISYLGKKVNALCKIAMFQAMAGDRTGADATFRLAWEELTPFGKETQGFMAMEEIALAKAKIGDFEGAKEIAAKIPNALYKDRVIAGTITAQVESGNLQDAWEASSSITNKYLRAGTRAKIVRWTAQAGQMQEAIDMTKSIGDHIDAPVALYYVGVLQAKSGDLAEAEKTITQIREPYNHAAALHALAMTYARAGAFDKAVHAISSEGEGYWRGNTLRDIAAIQSGTGDVAGALSWIHEEGQIGKSYALLGVAEGILKRLSLPRRIKQGFPWPQDCEVSNCPFSELLLSK
jgi:tetratricopeptide (TPR) repeat protein